MSPPPRLVALYSGLIIKRDAISGSLLAKLAALRNARDDLGVEVVAFCQHSEIDDPSIEVVRRGVPDLVQREKFRRACLHVFEFGIYYELFNTAMLLPPHQMAAVYHNITPPELIIDPFAKTRIEYSFNQKHLLDRMSRVACVSELNRRDLIEFGIPPERLTLLPLPPLNDSPPGPLRGSGAATEPVRFLFVGRMVRSKGVMDLLAAASALVEAGETGFELRLAGRVEFADELTINAINRAVASSSLGPHLRFTPDIGSSELAAAYQSADAFVLPSYHEGYCVPILEALSAACPVIAYDNSNIPAVSSGLADLVPTGNVEALAGAMQRTIDMLRAARSARAPYLVTTSRGQVPEPEWRSLAHKRVEGLRRVHDEGFVDFVGGLLDGENGASGTPLDYSGMTASGSRS